jgi:hypothetical protein
LLRSCIDVNNLKAKKFRFILYAKLRSQASAASGVGGINLVEFQSTIFLSIFSPMKKNNLANQVLMCLIIVTAAT